MRHMGVTEHQKVSLWASVGEISNASGYEKASFKYKESYFPYSLFIKHVSKHNTIHAVQNLELTSDTLTGQSQV